jgi:SOS regulatory protein LexA
VPVVSRSTKASVGANRRIGTGRALGWRHLTRRTAVRYCTAMSNDRSYLERLQDYYARHRALPSYASIGSLLGLRSKSSVAAMVARLKLAGYLDSTPDKRLAPTKRFFARPLAESPVRAGMASVVDDAPADALTIDDYLIERPSQTVLIRVKGDSMIDAGILEGDLVVVEKSSTAKRGDVVVAIVDNQFTLKRLDVERGQFVLRPENKAYPVIRPEGDLEIFGVMVGLVRKL